MYRGKYSAVIGRSTRFFVCAQYELSRFGHFSFLKPITALYFTPYINQIMEFHQTTVRATVIDPSHNLAPKPTDSKSQDFIKI
jgi:hypothetical protein